MTEYITVKLTDDQLDVLIWLINDECLRVTQDDNYAWYHRLRQKLYKAKQLAKAKS